MDDKRRESRAPESARVAPERDSSGEVYKMAMVESSRLVKAMNIGMKSRL